MFERIAAALPRVGPIVQPSPERPRATASAARVASPEPVAVAKGTVRLRVPHIYVIQEALVSSHN